MKKIVVLGLLVVILGFGVAIAGSYHVVRAKDGYHLVEKESFSLGDVFVDTRDWNVADWLKNKNISKAMAQEKLGDLKDRISDSWNRFSKKVDKTFDDFEMSKVSQDFEREAAKLRKEAKKQFDAASKRFEEGGISKDDFEKKLDQITAWLEKQLAALKKKFE